MTITAETSSVTGFVAELVRAANEVDRVTASEIATPILICSAMAMTLFANGCSSESGSEQD